MSEYTIKIWGRTLTIRADFRQGSDSIEILGYCDEWVSTQYQTADFCHDPNAAMRAIASEWVVAYGDDPDDPVVSQAIDDAIERMVYDYQIRQRDRVPVRDQYDSPRRCKATRTGGRTMNDNDRTGTYRTTLLGEEYAIRADWNNASAQIEIEQDAGEWVQLGKQVADYGHSPQACMAEYLRQIIEDSGDFFDDFENQINDAISRMK